MKKIIFSLLFLSSIILLPAQETIPVTGGNASSTDGSVCYTIGQLVYSTYIGSDGSVAEGVQQPYEISIVTGFDYADEFSLKCSAYPNPTKDKLTLHFENYDCQDLQYQLYDQKGNLLGIEKITTNNSLISMKNNPVGNYFLKVNNGQEEIVVFKIVKY